MTVGAGSKETDSCGERSGEKGFPANGLWKVEGHVNDVLEDRVAVNTVKTKGTAYGGTGKVNNGATIKVQL